VIETGKCLAGLHGIEADELGRITSENFTRLFGVPPLDGVEKFVSA
jgi:Tat protein secretion system quality control protein TatD with DNase activity